MEQLLEFIKQHEHIIIFGYSEKGRILYQLINNYSLANEIVFCDNDSAKQNLGGGFTVYSVEEATHRYRDGGYLIPSPFFSEEKHSQLSALGISKDCIFDAPAEIILRIEGKKRFIPLTEDEFRFEFCITKHCNLNCRSCDHFCPLVEQQEFMDFDVFSCDIQRLSELFHAKAEQILILGGEPLLSPDILKYMRLTRKCFPHANIYIVTNGILLDKMEEDFWETCRNQNIGLRPTRYPIKVDYEALGRLAHNKGVDYHFFGSTEISVRNMWHHPFDLSGQQNIEDNFLLCYSGNRCITLENGRLYTCPIPMTSRAFVAYFHKELKVEDADSIDIYKVNSSQEILDKLAKPIPFCKYCDVKNRTYDHFWELSHKDIKEWTL